MVSVKMGMGGMALFRMLLILGCSLLLMLLNPVQALAITVIVDAGHGGSDPGAIGVGGLKEKDVNLDIALKLQEELLFRGHDVHMIRETDTFLSLQERVKLARSLDGDLFVSIHANAHTNKEARGSLVLYFDKRYPQAAYPPSSEMVLLSDESAELARLVLQGLLTSAGTIDRGTVPSSAYVVRNGNMPSVLVETAFISNVHDAALLASDNQRWAMAVGIANGIEAYSPPVFIDISKHWAKAHVLHLHKLGIVNGYEGRFHPDTPMTRAEYMTVLHHIFHFDRMLDAREEEPSSQTDELAFADLQETHWAYHAMSQAVKLGFLGGYEDGTLRPNQPLNRAEMAVILDRVTRLSVDLHETEQVFIDVPSDSWYAHAVHKLYHQALIGGREGNVFGPLDRMTRAEGITVLDRFLTSPHGQVALEALYQHNVM